jgi:DNA-binding transcriptional LysR family regulator
MTAVRTVNRQINVTHSAMDVSVLQLFVDVFRQGSFAAVARDRNLDPSSVSRAIAGLEEELGIRLFQRTTRQLSATEAGTTYFERIESLVDDLQQATVIAADISKQPKGTLRVTASVSFGLKCIVPLLPEFTRQYPDLTIDLLLSDTITDLIAERIDVAIRLGHLTDSTLIAQQLMPTHYSVCASPDYLKQSEPLQNPMDLINCNCLLFPFAGFRSRWIFKNHQGELIEVPVFGHTVISSAIALQQCAIAGMGVALLPNWLIDQELQAGQLVNVFPNYEVTATDFSTAAWLIYPSRTYIPLKVRVFVDFLKHSVSDYVG